MSSPSKETESEVPRSSIEAVKVSQADAATSTGPAEPRPPAKRRLSGARAASAAVIEISDTESDDSDVCAVTSYQASADEVKRIRGDDYSSSSSSSDYSSDSDSPWEDDSVVVADDKPHSKFVRAQLNTRANRMDNPKLNPMLKSQEVMERLTTHWRESKDHSSAEATLTCDPYRVCLLHELLADADIINNIIDDMNTLDWSRKKLDLYEFHQTADLATLTWQRGIKGIYELLKTEIRNWVTGLELTSVSASCSLYGPGDHLLPHDDRLADRRVAFILYLAPWRLPPRPRAGRGRPRRPGALENGGGNGAGSGDDDVDPVDVEACGWAAHMGGALELLSCDAGGRPRDVARAVYPRNNMLAFFRVGHETFHQVGEVLSMELPRLSINGWFHGPAPADEPALAPAPAPPAPADEPAPAPPPDEPEPPEAVEPHTDIVLLNQWVEATYMSPRNRVQIQSQMESESEVCLRDLLLPARLQEVLDALRQPDVPWERAGPAHRRRYSRLPRRWVEAQAAAHGARALLRLLTSAAFVRLLADCTDLVLTRCRGLELQRWAPGDYTMLPPREQYQEGRLEAVMYLGVPARPVCGGHTTYVAPEEPGDVGGEGGALVTLPPTDNALNLVYCDAGAVGFTKYLSRMTMRPQDHFYILTCTYLE